MTLLRLQTRAPSPVPLDDVLVAVVTLTDAGPVPVRTGTGLSPAADLAVTVAGPTGEVPVPWPWPVDLAPPRVELAPGRSLAAGVLLAWSSRSLFDRPARYGITCSFRPHPAEELTADRVEVTRSALADAAVAALLARADVARSLIAGAVLDAATPGLVELRARAALTRACWPRSRWTTSQLCRPRSSISPGRTGRCRSPPRSARCSRTPATSG